MPFQLMYGGKTKRCHPPQSFPTDWNITHNVKLWSNEETMVEYIFEVIIPHVKAIRENIHCEPDQVALAIFDCFKGQLSAKITNILEHSLCDCTR